MTEISYKVSAMNRTCWNVLPSLFALLTWLLAATRSLAAAPTVTQSRPLLFFYPPPYQYSDGSHLNSPQTITVEQATTKVPIIPELSGIVLMVYWSTLCPTEITCDFSLLDKVISYWAERGRKVVLDVATIGYPIVSPPGKNAITTATPEWVLNRVGTYSYNTRVLGKNTGSPAATTRFPDFRSSSFVSEVDSLIRELARRYDGNPTISQVRIATGAMGEDNPVVGPYSNTISNYNERMWIVYCEEILHAFQSAFRSTQLEFDIGRLAWTYVKGDASDKEAVSAFLSQLKDAGIFLAFDGLGTGSNELLVNHAENRSGIARALNYVRDFRIAHNPAGLEAIGPLASNNMVDIDGILKATALIHPEHEVFFYDFVALVDYERNGLNEQNRTAIQSFSQDQLISLKSRAMLLLGGLGY